MTPHPRSTQLPVHSLDIIHLETEMVAPDAGVVRREPAHTIRATEADQFEQDAIGRFHLHPVEADIREAGERLDVGSFLMSALHHDEPQRFVEGHAPRQLGDVHPSMSVGQDHAIRSFDCRMAIRARVMMSSPFANSRSGIVNGGPSLTVQRLVRSRSRPHWAAASTTRSAASTFPMLTAQTIPVPA